jgi:hypothetical protein
MSESTSDPKLAALEESLAALVPVPGRIERDQLLFRAGQASRTRGGLWPLIETLTSMALLTVVAAALGMTLVLRAVPVPVERIVYVAVPQTTAPMPGVKSEDVASARSSRSILLTDTEDLWANSAEYLQQRNQAIRWGVDALPTTPSVASSMPTPTVESMLGLPERKMEQAGMFPLKF